MCARLWQRQAQGRGYATVHSARFSSLRSSMLHEIIPYGTRTHILCSTLFNKPASSRFQDLRYLKFDVSIRQYHPQQPAKPSSTTATCRQHAETSVLAMGIRIFARNFLQQRRLVHRWEVLQHKGLCA